MPFFPHFGLEVEGLRGEPLKYAMWALSAIAMPTGLFFLTTPRRLAYDADGLTLPDGERLPWKRIAHYRLTSLHGASNLLLRLDNGEKRTVRGLWLGPGWRAVLKHIPQDPKTARNNLPARPHRG